MIRICLVHYSNKNVQARRVWMRKSVIATGLAALAVLLGACGANTDTSQVESSTILVTKFNGQLNLTSTRQASLVDSLGILQHMGSADFLSKTEVIAAQDEGSESGIFKSYDEGKSWNQQSDVPGLVSSFDFVGSQAGFALSNANGGSLFATLNGGQTWVEMDRGQFEAIGFVTAQIGFAVMKSPQSSQSGAATGLYKSDNGGKTWAVIKSPLIPSAVSASFSFASPTQGWLLAGSRAQAGTETKYLYQTVDSGSSWSVIAQSATESNPPPTSGSIPSAGFVGQLQFISSSVGFMNLLQLGFLESGNGGKTWTQLPLAGLPVQTAHGIVQFSAWGAASFSIATDHSSLWLTTSADKWSRIYPPYREAGLSGGLNGLYSLSQSGQLSSVQTSASQLPISTAPYGAIEIDPFANGFAAYTPSKIYMTVDGKHWDEVPVPSGWSIMQGHFISTNFGIVVANDKGPPGSAVIELTKNSGSNWETVSTKFRPYAIDPVTVSSWWAIGGTDLTVTSNTAKLGSRQMTWNLYFTSDGGKSWDEFIANWHAPGGLDFLSVSEGYVWVSGSLYHTMDRGSSFTRILLPSQIAMEGISTMAFQSGGVGWALGNSGYPIYHTIDGGVYWGPNP